MPNGLDSKLGRSDFSFAELRRKQMIIYALFSEQNKKMKTETGQARCLVRQGGGIDATRTEEKLEGMEKKK